MLICFKFKQKLIIIKKEKNFQHYRAKLKNKQSKTELEKVTLFKRLNKFLLIVNIFFCFYSKLKSKIFLPQHYQLELHFS